MGEDTAIQWTDRTWNPWHGCHKISPGCKLCYMFRDKKRYGQDPNIVVRSKTTFNDPLKWPQEPAMCFTCSWSDWLIEEADPWRDEAYDIIRRTPWITYQILTKRIDRATGRVPIPALPNIWWGVSAESQEYADKRIPLLLDTPAATRFVSYEPALGPVDFTNLQSLGFDALYGVDYGKRKIDWVIVGGESGPSARPFDIDWARKTLQQCKANGVACFVKQLGATPVSRPAYPNGNTKGETVFLDLKDRKGGDMAEWPIDLRVRQWPEVTR